MKMKDYLPAGEKGFRSSMYLSGQAKKANEIPGAMNVWDFLNVDTEDGIDIVTSDGWYPLEYCDALCRSPFIDGDYGYSDPDERLFFKVENYGKTWAAVKTSDVKDEKDWKAINAVQDTLKKIAEPHRIWWWNPKTKAVYVPEIGMELGKFDSFNRASNWMRVKRFNENNPPIKIDVRYFERLSDDFDFEVWVMDEELL